MGFFDHLQSKGAPSIKPQIAKVKKEVVRVDVRSATSRTDESSGRRGKVFQSISLPQQKGLKENAHVAASHRKPKRPSQQSSNAQKRSRITQTLLSSSEESDSEASGDEQSSARKRAKTGIATIDPSRQLRALSDLGPDADSLIFINAADIASTVSGKKYTAKSGITTQQPRAKLRYPGHPKAERYELVLPLESEVFNPIDEIIHTIQLISTYYLPTVESRKILDETGGLIRHLKRSLARDNFEDFKEKLKEFNELIVTLFESGDIARCLDDMQRPPLQLVECILTQVYARTVSLKVESLRKYENGTDNVYGELLPRFVSTIFADTGIKSNHIFVDLGSGVANVVLQAALEIGCESWGCEMMENACVLADLQEQEFKARCKLWGILPGSIHLERGDFLLNSAISKILRQADVVLVNNQAFTPQLNDGLVNLFLDLKEGCNIVSLKSFVPPDHKITTRNINSPLNLLDVTQKTYFSNCVSWTNAPGTYFISKKDSSRLRRFEGRLTRR